MNNTEKTYSLQSSLFFSEKSFILPSFIFIIFPPLEQSNKLSPAKEKTVHTQLGGSFRH